MNVNDSVSVILTPAGCRVFKSDPCFAYLEQQYPGWRNKLTMPLWELMQTFGEHFYNGGPELFVDNEIEAGNGI